jgi:hypothetical protein
MWKIGNKIFLIKLIVCASSYICWYPKCGSNGRRYRLGSWRSRVALPWRNWGRRSLRIGNCYFWIYMISSFCCIPTSRHWGRNYNVLRDCDSLARERRWIGKFGLNSGTKSKSGTCCWPWIPAILTHLLMPNPAGGRGAAGFDFCCFSSLGMFV